MVIIALNGFNMKLQFHIMYNLFSTQISLYSEIASFIKPKYADSLWSITTVVAHETGTDTKQVTDKVSWKL